MRYNINYDPNPNKNFKYIDEVDEITILYKRKDTTLLDFLLKHSGQRVNIYIADAEDFLNNNCINIFSSIKEKYPLLNFVLFFSDKEKELLQKVKDYNLKYFFTTYVKDWDSLHYMAELKPTDIFIVEALCFELKDVAKFLHSQGIDVRCFANVAQSSSESTPALKNFFIRPEDVDFYEPYIDCIEFFGHDLDDYQINTYYKVYKYDKEWFGNLREIIIGLDVDIKSYAIIPSFPKYRLNCGKRCLKGRKCKICETILETSATLEKKGLIFKNN